MIVSTFIYFEKPLKASILDITEYNLVKIWRSFLWYDMH